MKRLHCRWMLPVLAFVLSDCASTLAQDAAPVAQLPSFAVISVKRNKDENTHRINPITADGMNLRMYSPMNILISSFGLLEQRRVIGAPSWFSNEYYDVAAKVDDPDIAALAKLTPCLLYTSGEFEAVGDHSGVIPGGLLRVCGDSGGIFLGVLGDDDREISGRKEEGLVPEETGDSGQGHRAAVTSQFRERLTFCDAIRIPRHCLFAPKHADGSEAQSCVGCFLLLTSEKA